jgi:hypothetical protein
MSRTKRNIEYQNEHHYRPSKKKQLKLFGWISAHIKPTGKFWKRQASKKVRHTKDILNGCDYRRIFGWMEWS